MHDKTLLMTLYKKFNDGELDYSRFCKMLARAVVEVLNGSRASIWRFAGTLQDRLTCESMYDRATNQWSNDAEMLEDDCGDYFAAILSARRVAAQDAHLQADTACLDRLGFTPATRYALLDVLIEADGVPLGVVRCERDGATEWSADDDVFLRQVAAMLGLVCKKCS